MNDYSWLKILLVEDEDDARILYQETLQFAFPNVSVAANGAEGWEAYQQLKPHIVISDIRMPVMDGLEMSEKIKNDNPHLPIIIISAHSENDFLYAAIEVGIDTFVNKPVKMKEMLGKVKTIANRIHQEEKFVETKKLLEEYRNTVDETFLVSKTDLKGNIIFANEHFCKLSRYSREELIGKNHRIVRHPETPDHVFADMWGTILAGQTWNGIVKNRTKNGSYYIVETHVKPIIDHHGNITEFISIRRDITEQEEYREYLKNQLGTTEHDLREKLALLTQYENAIEISTAFCRSDLNENIVYANKTFSQVTGYSREELSGMSKTELMEADEKPCLLEKLPSCCGNVRVKTKEGDIRHLTTTVVPIYDAEKEIREFMSISHDITEVVLLKEEVENTQREFFYRLGEMAELRSKETGQHVRRVAFFSEALAIAAGLPHDEVEMIKLAAPLHDAGKIAVPDAVLNKPGKLTPEEFEVMKTHATIGHEMFKDSEREILKAAAMIAYTHHEKWDGSGYPRGLQGADIPLPGRIVAIADVYDALGCDRVYKKGWEHEKIVAFFTEQRGRHFDPALIDLFFEIIPQILSIKEEYSD